MKKIYRVIGGTIGFLFGILLFINFNFIWYELGQLEVFGFMAIVVIIILILVPLLLIVAPFVGAWIGVRLAGKLNDNIYLNQERKL